MKPWCLNGVASLVALILVGCGPAIVEELDAPSPEIKIETVRLHFTDFMKTDSGAT